MQLLTCQPFIGKSQWIREMQVVTYYASKSVLSRNCDNHLTIFDRQMDLAVTMFRWQLSLTWTAKTVWGDGWLVFVLFWQTTFPAFIDICAGVCWQEDAPFWHICEYAWGGSGFIGYQTHLELHHLPYMVRQRNGSQRYMYITVTIL